MIYLCFAILFGIPKMDQVRRYFDCGVGPDSGVDQRTDLMCHDRCAYAIERTDGRPPRRARLASRSVWFPNLAHTVYPT